MKKIKNEVDRAALEVLRQTGINVLDAALIAREALEIGRGRLKRAKRCIELGDKALRRQEKTVTFITAVTTALDERIERRPRSLNDFRYLSRRLIKRCPHLAQRRIRSITPQECSAYIRQAFNTPRQRNKARLVLSGIFSTAVKHGWCTENPISKVAIEKISERKIAVLTKEEIHKLIMSAARYKGGICLAAVGIMLYAGVRPNEVERLTWSQVHMESGVIHILPQHSKTGGARQVTIYPPLAALLNQAHELRMDRQKMVCPNNWRKHWAELHRLAGWTGGKKWVEDILRHTFASYHIVTFRSYAELQFEMGHRSAELLRTRYIAMEGIKRDDNFWAAPSGETNPHLQTLIK